MIDLRSNARRRLLSYYFTNPEGRWHVRDLAARLALDPSNLAKELSRLQEEGLFHSQMSGRQKYFELNPSYPLFEEVRGIVMKTVGVAPAISEAIAKIAGIQEAWLYGSFASGEQDAASDIDVLIVGTPRSEDIAQVIRALEKQLGREINYTTLSAGEFKRRRARKDPFLENLWRNKRIALRSSHGEVQASND